MKKTAILFLGILLSLSSCSKDNEKEMPAPEEETGYAGGVLVLNEGNFGSGNSSVSFVNPALDEVNNGIYAAENSGATLGDVAQNIAFYKDYAFIVLNVSNKIEVVDRSSFQHIASIESGLSTPRYITFANDKAYVTNWGDGTDPNDDFIAVIEPANFSIIKNISVAEGPERIIANNNKLYVAHPGGYSFNNKISVIDAESDEVKMEKEVGDVPNAMLITNGSLWLSCSGKPSYAEQETAGEIVKLDLSNMEIKKDYVFSEETMHPSNLGHDGNELFYTLGKSVYSFEENAENLPESAGFELTEISSLYGFEVNDGKVFAASANSDFTGNGELYIYETAQGNLLTSFQVGINPNGIYFNQ